jgi:hypothetical protein
LVIAILQVDYVSGGDFMHEQFYESLKDAIKYGCTQPISMITQHKLDEKSREELLAIVSKMEQEDKRS